ncbi:MAG: hypothetical protein GY730_02260 [bacterium]|nr:hypothetical protein [bacterium]
MHFKKITVRQWIKIMKSMGLVISDKTGGYLMKAPDIYKIIKSETVNYKMLFKNGTSISFIDQTQFLKTVQATEKSLDIKLFS